MKRVHRRICSIPIAAKLLSSLSLADPSPSLITSNDSTASTLPLPTSSLPLPKKQQTKTNLLSSTSSSLSVLSGTIDTVDNNSDDVLQSSLASQHAGSMNDEAQEQQQQQQQLPPVNNSYSNSSNTTNSSCTSHDDDKNDCNLQSYQRQTVYSSSAVLQKRPAPNAELKHRRNKSEPVNQAIMTTLVDKQSCPSTNINNNDIQCSDTESRSDVFLPSISNTSNEKTVNPQFELSLASTTSNGSPSSQQKQQSRNNGSTSTTITDCKDNKQTKEKRKKAWYNVSSHLAVESLISSEK
ncbi:unnamed protein product [Didymodactylos carnosus]|uniref:Uncharacterized protein n=1 Tax=Didymodactylos carnosus TaxID=1234261 RepID=A0A8S2FSR2_9BILA|nr:unnamed protein product [Didymodactylos carnosus]CAF4340716.1 unnamed protein product [Didymodactylos carnosus]